MPVKRFYFQQADDSILNITQVIILQMDNFCHERIGSGSFFADSVDRFKDDGIVFVLAKDRRHIRNRYQ